MNRFQACAIRGNKVIILKHTFDLTEDYLITYKTINVFLNAKSYTIRMVLVGWLIDS